jgi:peptidoglycan biosynthesis protein MviN/MurJ (putative lipid II flippase)
LKSVKQWLDDDWKYNRFRLIIETSGAICFISVYVILAWFGDDASVFTIFLLTLAGASLHTINAYLRQSINLILLNIIVICVTLFGIYKMFML